MRERKPTAPPPDPTPTGDEQRHRLLVAVDDALVRSGERAAR